MKRIVRWWLVRRRISELEYATSQSGQVEMAWLYELAYIRRTGKLDWVNPNPMRMRPAGSVIKPPAPRPRD